MRNSGQDGGVGRYTLPPHTTKRRTTNLKTKKQWELPENRTVWKSDTQGVKEETFIQTDRRGRDGQPGWKGLVARRWLEDQAVPHLRADKPEGTTGEWDRPHSPGLQHGEIKPQTSEWKNWGLWQWEKLPASQESPLERPTGSWNVHKPTHLGITIRRAQFACA